MAQASPCPLERRDQKHSSSEWEKHREIFTKHYLHLNHTLPEVMEVMEKDHGFKANSQAYKRRIRRWNIGKRNAKRQAQNAALRDMNQSTQLLGSYSDLTISPDSSESQIQAASMHSGSYQSHELTPVCGDNDISILSAQTDLKYTTEQVSLPVSGISMQQTPKYSNMTFDLALRPDQESISNLNGFYMPVMPSELLPPATVFSDMQYSFGYVHRSLTYLNPLYLLQGLKWTRPQTSFTLLNEPDSENFLERASYIVNFGVTGEFDTCKIKLRDLKTRMARLMTSQNLSDSINVLLGMIGVCLKLPDDIVERFESSLVFQRPNISKQVKDMQIIIDGLIHARNDKYFYLYLQEIVETLVSIESWCSCRSMVAFFNLIRICDDLELLQNMMKRMRYQVESELSRCSWFEASKLDRYYWCIFAYRFNLKQFHDYEIILSEWTTRRAYYDPASMENPLDFNIAEEQIKADILCQTGRQNDAMCLLVHRRRRVQREKSEHRSILRNLRAQIARIGMSQPVFCK